MKYQPKQLGQNHNVSHENPLKEFFTLLLGASVLFVAFVIATGFFVDRAVAYINPELEARLFNNAMLEAFASEFESGDQEQQLREEELQSMLDQLGVCIDVGYPVRLRLMKSEELNAFAYPGGSIVVLSALADTLKTENGMAFVLAHELAHFKNRDHLRGMGRSLVILAASVAVTGVNSGLSSLLTPALGLDSAQFSQGRESDADATALHALHCYAGNVRDATEFFDHMKQQEALDDWSAIHYFSSHPEVGQRIKKIRALAEESGYQQD
ncbi:MAG: M48 family metallopeptidase [Pseudomonadota bacterium]